MKKISISSLLVSTLCMLFSCQSIDKPLGKIRLNENQLSEVVMDMKEYQAFVYAYHELQRNIETRTSELSQEDAEWIQSIHGKYEQHDDFLRLAKKEEIKKYNFLTGIDLIQEQSSLTKSFELLKEKLDEHYLYDNAHFVNLLSPENL
ncbi:MAG: hypothetical protein R8P61_31780 [Bacteroidia bacterium]|nr:hypothetical protein [Bacteroidia bacterium]